jgi:hypothetical protein
MHRALCAVRGRRRDINRGLSGVYGRPDDRRLTVAQQIGMPGGRFRLSEPAIRALRPAGRAGADQTRDPDAAL